MSQHFNIGTDGKPIYNTPVDEGPTTGHANGESTTAEDDNSTSAGSSVGSVVGINHGIGHGVFAGTNGRKNVVLDFRTIVAGEGIKIDTDVNTLTITSTGAISDDINGFSGTLTVSKGGTGVTSFPLQALLMGNGAGPLQSIALPPKANTVLTWNGSAYVWTTPTGGSGSSGTVTSVGVSSASPKLSVAGGPITSSGTFTLDVVEANIPINNLNGTLAVTKGGTGATSFATNGIVIGGPSLTSTLAPTAPNQALVWDGSAFVWRLAGSVTSVNMAAGSPKVLVGGGPITTTGSFTVDISEANMTLNNIGGTLGVNKGGTGLNVIGSAKQVLRVNATGNALEYATLSATDITGLSTVAATGAYSDLTNRPLLAAVATSGNYNDLLNKPSFGTGTVTSANILPGSSRISATGGPITTAGSITVDVNEAYIAINNLSGVLNPTKGGTGRSALTVNSLLVGNGTSAVNFIDAPTVNGSYLTWNGTAFVWSIPQVATNGTVTSVNVTPTSNKVSVTGGPITSSGSIAIDINESNLSLDNLGGTLSAAKVSGLATVATSGNYNDLSNKPASYALPAASGTTLGGVKIGANLVIDAQGVLSAVATGNGTVTSVNVAAGSNKMISSGGPVTSTGTITLDINESFLDISNMTGAISTARVTGLAAVAKSGDFNDLINKPIGYTLPVASEISLGGFKVGPGLAIDAQGVLSVTATGGSGDGSSYTLPTASLTTLGGIKVGQGLSIDAQGALNVSLSSGNGLPGGQFTQIQYNNNGTFAGAAGLTTDGTNLTVSGGKITVRGSANGGGLYATGTSVVLSESNNLVTFDTSQNWGHARTTAPLTAGGRYYAEYEIVSLEATTTLAIGVGTQADNLTTSTGGVANAGDGTRLQYFNDGRKRQSGVYSTYGAPFTAGDIIGLAVDMTTYQVTMYKNGVSQGVLGTVSNSASYTFYGWVSAFENVIDEATSSVRMLITPRYSIPAGHTNINDAVDLVSVSNVGAIVLGANAGTAGQYLSSNGTNAAVTWKSLPIASTSAAGMVKVGSGLSVDANGLLSATGGGSATPAGATTQLQYNNAGSFAGASGVTTDGTNLTVAGNFTMSGTAKQFVADFTSAVGSGTTRTYFVSNVGNTYISALPKAGSSWSSFIAYNNNDPANAAALEVGANSTGAIISSYANGTGTAQPIKFVFQNVEKFTLTSAGAIGLATNYGTAGQVLTSGGTGAAATWTTPATYTLPTASSTVLGGVKVGSGLSINAGVLSATNTNAGTVTSVGVAVGSTKLSVTGSPITSSGTITLDVNEANLNLANIGGNLAATKVTGLATVATTGAYSDLIGAPAAYALPTASSTVLGGIKLGSGLAIDANGVVNVTVSGDGSGTGTGTVTSVAVAAGSTKLSVTGSPITSSGTINIDVNEANLSLANLGGTLGVAKITGLATVATTGSYTDLTNKPTAYTDTQARAAISATGSLSYNSTTGVISYTAPTLATVATSGSYNDLLNKPTIPAAYTLPTASSTVLGGVKVGANLSIDAQGVLSATAGGTGTVTSVAVAAGSTKVSVTGSPITSSGTINVDVNEANLSISNMTGNITAARVTGLATVATTGSYNDLLNKPTAYTDSQARAAISATGSLSYNSTTGVISYTAPVLATVATSGNYNDLTNKPAAYSLPIASSTVLGGFKVGANLSIDAQGVLSATAGGTGTVTSVAVAAGSNKLTVTGSPITSSGTINVDISEANLSIANMTGSISTARVTGLATVATSGSYTDLTNKPTIPAAYTDSQARAAISATGSLSYNSTTGVISYTAPTLATVATSGSYTDLTNKPTIPAAYTDSQARAAISLNAGTSGATYNSTTGVLDLSALSTGGGTGSGEINTASNVGATGVGLFYQKSGVDLQFKKLVAGSNVTLTDNGTTVTIDAAAGSGGGATVPANSTAVGSYTFSCVMNAGNVTATGSDAATIGISNLPAGWTASAASGVTTITHNVGRPPRTVSFYVGTGSTTNPVFVYISGANTAAFGAVKVPASGTTALNTTSFQYQLQSGMATIANGTVHIMVTF